MTIVGSSRAAFPRAASLALVLGFSLVHAPALAEPAAAVPAKPAASAPAAKPSPKAAPTPGAAPKAPVAPKNEAKELVSAGEKKLKAQDYAGALADFEASLALKADPATQRYIAMTLDVLKRYPEAIAAYEKFIAENPPKMKDQVDEASWRIEAIKVLPGILHVVTTPEGASVVLDGANAPYEKVTPVAIEVTPGKHSVLIGAEGFENATKDVDVPLGQTVEVTAELTKKAPPPPVATPAPEPAAPPAPAPPPAEARSLVPAYVTGGVAIAAAGLGTYFGIRALQQSSEFDKSPTKEKADDGENNALVADMMFGVAITFGVTSAVLFFTNDAPASAQASGTKVAQSSKKNTVKVLPAPYVTPTGGGFGTLIRF